MTWKKLQELKHFNVFQEKEEMFATTLSDLELTAKAKTLKCISFEKTKVFATTLIDTDCKS